MPVEVRITGGVNMGPIRNRLDDPATVDVPRRKFLKSVGNLGRKDVRGRIPRGRTGRGRRSVRVKVETRFWRVRVFSKLFYLKFLAGGTVRGIKALRMFVESAKAIQPQARKLHGAMVQEITDTLRGR